MATTNTTPLSHYYADREAPICPLVIKQHFDSLTDTEKRYAHHISRASWLGGRVILQQTTPHSSDLFDLLLITFSASADTPQQLADLDALRTAANLDAETFQTVLEYAAQVLSNLANYKSFGDVKFIPRAPVDAFRSVVVASPRHAEALPLFDRLADEIYSVEPAARTQLGYPDEGHVINYYSANVTKEDIKVAQSFCESRQISLLNTRLFKRDDGTLQLRIASADLTASLEVLSYEGRTIELSYGDFQKEMAAVAGELASAIPHAAGEHQRKMLEHYVRHFRSGSIEEHKDSQREWIRDVGPVVESNIGFVETYRDPDGTRAEFEGFVAVVNKEMTKKFERMVNAAPQFIPKLPWGAAFEKDTFHKPDFTSLEILSFATGGVPAGINIPNYDDIRQTFGFKNVSLGNVMNAKAPGEKITFLSEEDAKLFEKLRGPAFEVQVGIHELLGHGTGKLFQQEKNGEFNFPRDNPPTNPLTGRPIEHWYGPGETWGSRFKAIAASYEECRAESVAMFLSTDKDMLAIFGHTDNSDAEGLADDIMYVGWLQMCRAGLLALEFYDPVARKWGQAHMQARHAILRVLLEAGDDLVRIEPVGDADLLVTLDRSKIHTVGMAAIGRFLTELQVYKATGDLAGGQALYDRYTSVPDSWMPSRKIVLAKKLPRKLLLQANTFIDENGVVSLKEYSADLPGFLQSYLERTI